MKKTVIFIMAFLISVLCGCNVTTDKKSSDTFDIVTSFYPMYVLALNVTEGAYGVQVNNMTPSIDGCLHDYSLTARDMKLIEESDAFIASGLGAEAFLDELLNVTLIVAADGTNRTDGDNPHVWMNCEDYAAQIDYVAQKLAELDEKNGAIYKENAEKYKKKVYAAYANYDSIGCAGKKAVLLDDSLYYAAQTAGIEIVAHVHDEAEGQHNAGELAEVIKTAKELGADIILTRAGFEESICQTISKETNAKVVYLDPVLEAGASNIDAYQTAVQNNAAALQAACK